MNNPVNFKRFKRLSQGVAISKINLCETEAVMGALKLRKPVTLQLNAVVIVQVVNSDDLFATFEQSPGNMMTDEPSSAGYKYWHGLSQFL